MDTKMTDNVKKQVDKMVPNILDKIGDYVDDILEVEVFNNVEFVDISWSDKIHIVNYVLEKIREVI